MNSIILYIWLARRIMMAVPIAASTSAKLVNRMMSQFLVGCEQGVCVRFVRVIPVGITKAG